jgi:hypothetical protein
LPFFAAITAYEMKTLTNCLSGLLLAAAAFIFSETSVAQCVAPPAQPECSGAALANNDNLTSGVTKVVTGTSTFSGLTMNGGTLVVCGTLNLSSFTFNSGTIYVNGTLNVNTSASIIFGANCGIYNYGAVYFASSIVTGANNLLMNCTPSSYFNIPFNQLVLQGPNTQLVNNGTFNSNYFIVQSNNSPAPICSGIGSVISTGIMINQYANGFTSPSGPSCVQITNTVINSQPMTATSNVNICYYGSSAAGLNFGSATVSLNCSSCSVALPVNAINLQGSCDELQVQLEWTTQSEQECGRYDVQLSEDGETFEDVREISCSGPSINPLSYTCVLENNALPEMQYVRVRRTDDGGNETFSQLLALDCLAGSTVNIFPTFVLGDKITIQSDDRITGVSMFGMDGRKVRDFEIQPDQKTVVLDVSGTAMGQYLLTVETPSARVDRLIRVGH